jgi:hypothetical protein
MPLCVAIHRMRDKQQKPDIPLNDLNYELLRSFPTADKMADCLSMMEYIFVAEKKGILKIELKDNTLLVIPLV